MIVFEITLTAILYKLMISHWFH